MSISRLYYVHPVWANTKNWDNWPPSQDYHNKDQDAEQRESQKTGRPGKNGMCGNPSLMTNYGRPME